ncbi:DUF3592 domain-containing protein [Roseiconus nitratireducens]|uniref:DUF3592 domain-containing protein n=1 Tax=Roseiconus nitratireducens TaxID=2605748 RepID=A0A5M6CTV6_9BACT|nr:DUF3592 domain-containing protein [Roseiconus nitratireducens]KAA5538651.1 DUF3592 domain-containing protein [Roseiconus nitratireducens]
MNQSPPQTMERIRRRFMPWYIALFVLLAGGISFILFRPLIRTWAYEPVTGIVVQSEMEYCGMEVSGYSAEIRFAYTVGNQEFRDGRLRPNVAQTCRPKETIAAILREYPVGAKVQGWYDPERPQFAVIDRSPGETQWTFIAVVCGFLFIFFCIWGMQRSNARRAAELARRRKAEAASASE